MSQSLKTAADRLENWIVQDALPLWQRVGISPEHGGHFEQLSADGNIDAGSNIRVRVQARQVFVFAFATHRGWCEGEAEARQLMRFIEQRAAHPTAGGGFVHLFSPDFQVIDTKQDLYDHSFSVLAYAWCYRVLGDRHYLDSAKGLLAYLDRRFGSQFGGWVEGDYPSGYRRQNPHMHMFEAMMTLHEATGEAHWLARAGELFALFQTRFYDPEREVLFEFFNDDWTLRHTPECAPVEPGHMMEWVWLLDWYHRLSGHPVDFYTEGLYRRALCIGQAQSGLLWDEVAFDGTILKHTQRCWGLTELIKASLVRSRSGDTDAEDLAVWAIDALFRNYLCSSTPGAYVDQRGKKGEVAVDKAPASTLYHLVVLAGEVSDYARASLA